MDMAASCAAGGSRFPPTLLCDLLSFHGDVTESNLPPSRQRWIWRRPSPPAGLDSRLHFCAPLFLFMAMLPNRTCLHRVSDGYGGVSRRRRVSIPVRAFRAVKVRFCFFIKNLAASALAFFHRRKWLSHVYISSAPLDGEARSVVKYTYGRPDHHDLCL